MNEVVLKILRTAAKALVVDVVPKDIQEFRYNVCLECHHRNAETDQCRICSCFLKLKTSAETNRNPLRARVEVTHCPIGKWNDLEIANYYRELDGIPLVPQT